MIPLLLALALGAQAQNAPGPGRLSGMWRTQIRIVDGDVQTAAELLNQEPETTWARLIWVFDDRSLTLATQVAAHPTGSKPPKNGHATRTTWCQAQLTVPLVWVNQHDLKLPPFGRVRTGGLRTAPGDDLHVSCNAELALGDLRQVPNGPGFAPEAVTLASPDARVVYVLLPDGEAASLERFIPE